MTSIEWTKNPDGSDGKSWNPIRARNLKTGKIGWHCEPIHEGCTQCYAAFQNERRGDSGGTGLPYKPGHRKDVEIYLDEKRLLEPLKWKKSQRIFVCSMTDLYGAWVPDEWLDKIKAVQTCTPQHTYIELTKRPARMRLYAGDRSAERFDSRGDHIARFNAAMFAEPPVWPLPNVWSLVSCSTQQDANEFIPILLQSEAKVRGVSLEPLLGSIDLGYLNGGGLLRINALTGEHIIRRPLTEGGFSDFEPAGSSPKLDWVIVGGESGKDARPMDPTWARSLRDQCASASVPFFFKQWGEFAPGELLSDGREEPWRRYQDGSADSWSFDEYSTKNITLPQVTFRRVGKGKSGRLLDGVTHGAWPEARS